MSYLNLATTLEGRLLFIVPILQRGINLKNLSGLPKATRSENSGARIPTQVDNSQHSATFRDSEDFRDGKGQLPHFVDGESETWRGEGTF